MSRTQVRQGKGPWRVVCDDWSSAHGSREAAERRKREVEAQGHCRHAHTIIDPDGNPVTGSTEAD